MTRENNESQKQQDAFADIGKELQSLNKENTKIADFLKKQSVQDLKARTQEKEPEKQEETRSDDEQKEMSALRKTFEKSFGGLKETFSPGGVLKSFGLLSGSPIFMMMGDKLDDMISSYGEFRKENKEAKALQEEPVSENFEQEDIRDKELQLAEQQVEILGDIKDNFTQKDIQDKEAKALQEEPVSENFEQEDIRDKEFQLAERKNEILADIRDKEFTVEEKDKKGGLLGGILGKIAAIFSAILPKSLLKILPKIFGGKGLKGIMGPGLKLLKGGLRLLGKLALPLALISGGIDFFSGFADGKEITGREGTAANIQAGFAKAISGFTFGLIDPQAISQAIDTIFLRLKEFLMMPIDLIKNLFSNEAFKEKLTYVGDIFKSAIETMFIEPFEFIKDLFNIEDIKQKIMDFTASIQEKINAFISIITNPINAIKDFFSQSGLSKAATFLGFDRPQTKLATTDKSSSFTNVQSENPALTEASTNIAKQRETAKRDKIVSQQNAVDKQTNNNNNLIQSTQNNLIVAEDMNTKTDDQDYLSYSMF